MPVQITIRDVPENETVGKGKTPAALKRSQAGNHDLIEKAMKMMALGCRYSCSWSSTSLHPRHHPRSMMLHFADVVHQAKEQPLSIDLGSTAQTEAIESMRMPKIGEYRLDRAEPATVLISTGIGIDFALHLQRS